MDAQQSPPNGVQRDLGKLEANQHSIETRLTNLERDVSQILLYVTTIKGLAHVIIVLGGVIGFLASVAEIVRFFKP